MQVTEVFLLLAEAETQSAHLVEEVNAAMGSARPLWELLPHSGNRIRAFTRYAPTILRPVSDSSYVKMLHLQPTIGLPILIVAAHLPSKLHADAGTQRYVIRELRDDITSQEARMGHQNTLVIGDLNVNPFEDALTAADGLHGVMDKEVAARSARTVRDRRWDYFYNPMWSRLGDESAGPPGTYWYVGSGLVNHFWNTFDQVLLRPGLLSCYDPGRLVVPDRVGERPILASGRGSGSGLSDHLPVVIGLSIERESQ